VLLDQQRTRKITRVVAIIMVIGLVGVLPIMLGVIIFGDSGQAASQSTLIEDAEAKVAKNPKDIAALVTLAAQYKNAGRNKDAEDTLDKAAAINPSNITELRMLFGAYAADTAKQTKIITAFTKSHPKNADGWMLAGTTSAAAGDLLGARLAYQRVIALAGAKSTLGQSAQAGIDQLAAQGQAQLEPTTPATP
jgi:cytochrome c-type biogenesis protein CcmH/NrfG